MFEPVYLTTILSAENVPLTKLSFVLLRSVAKIELEMSAPSSNLGAWTRPPTHKNIPIRPSE